MNGVKFQKCNNLQDRKITVDEYSIKMQKFKDRVGKIVEKMNWIQNDIKDQDNKIENQSIKSSIAIKNLEESVEHLEHDNKSHLKETLKI